MKRSAFLLRTISLLFLLLLLFVQETHSGPLKDRAGRHANRPPRQAAKVKAFQMTAPAAGQSIALGKKLNIRLVNVPYLRTPSKHGENLACGEPEMTFSLINSKGQRFEITDRNWNIETPDKAMQNFSIKIEK